MKLFPEENLLDGIWLMENGFKKGKNYMWIAPDKSFKLSVFNFFWEGGKSNLINTRNELVTLYYEKTGRKLNQ